MKVNILQSAFHFQRITYPGKKEESSIVQVIGVGAVAATVGLAASAYYALYM